jgi:ABC-type transport system involved in cytochrome bd biosynthesis fused ATPase/permease subunit
LGDPTLPGERSATSLDVGRTNILAWATSGRAGGRAIPLAALFALLLCALAAWQTVHAADRARDRKQALTSAREGPIRA